MITEASEVRTVLVCARCRNGQIRVLGDSQAASLDVALTETADTGERRRNARD